MRQIAIPWLLACLLLLAGCDSGGDGDGDGDGTFGGSSEPLEWDEGSWDEVTWR